MSTFFTALERAERERSQRHPAVVPSERTSERRPISSAESHNTSQPLTLRYDYSKFDIALYTAVVTIFSAALAFEPVGLRFHRGLLSLAVVLTCVAGLTAGMIASGLWGAKIGPLRWRCLRGQYWAYIQHACFCAALIAAVLSVLGVYLKWPPSLGCPQ